MSDQSAAGPTPRDDLTLEQWAAMPEDEPGELVDGRWEAAASWPGPPAARHRGRGDFPAASRCASRPCRENERLRGVRSPLVLADRSRAAQRRGLRARC